jgi:hypothetical protein
MLLSDANPKHNSSSADEECNNTPPGNSDVGRAVALTENTGQHDHEESLDDILGAFESPSERDKAFTFLQCANISQLTAACKLWRTGSYGRKEAIVIRLFSAIENSVPENGSILAALEQPKDRPIITRSKLTITEFLREQEIAGNPKYVPWRRAPSKASSIIASSSGPPLAEFARLLGILTNLPAVKTAIIDSGLERTRAQLDARIPRDSFWSTTVAPAFNDPSIVPSITSIDTWTDELDEAFRVARAPSFPRQGSELKRLYVDCRAAFTQC